MRARHLTMPVQQEKDHQGERKHLHGFRALFQPDVTDVVTSDHVHLEKTVTGVTGA